MYKLLSLMCLTRVAVGQYPSRNYLPPLNEGPEPTSGVRGYSNGNMGSFDTRGRIDLPNGSVYSDASYKGGVGRYASGTRSSENGYPENSNRYSSYRQGSSFAAGNGRYGGYTESLEQSNSFAGTNGNMYSPANDGNTNRRFPGLEEGTFPSSVRNGYSGVGSYANGYGQYMNSNSVSGGFYSGNRGQYGGSQYASSNGSPQNGIERFSSNDGVTTGGYSGENGVNGNGADSTGSGGFNGLPGNNRGFGQFNQNSIGDSNSEPAKYEFKYDVSAPDYGVQFGHEEQRDGDNTVGAYHVLLPDGRKQLVEYTADKDGFKPKISYTDVGQGIGNPSGAGGQRGLGGSRDFQNQDGSGFLNGDYNQFNGVGSGTNGFNNGGNGLNVYGQNDSPANRFMISGSRINGNSNGGYRPNGFINGSPGVNSYRTSGPGGTDYNDERRAQSNLDNGLGYSEGGSGPY